LSSASAGSVGKHFGESPALKLGKRLSFNDADAVADLCLAAFVMHVVFLGPFYDLVELRVRDASDVFDDEGLLHFVGDDNADTGLAKVWLGFLSVLAHGTINLRGLVGSGAFLGVLGGKDPCGFAADLRDAGRILQLAGGTLEAEVEGLLLEIAQILGELVSGELVEFFAFVLGHGRTLVGSWLPDQACGLRAIRRVRRPSL
jgi:hypothetical protein